MLNGARSILFASTILLASTLLLAQSKPDDPGSTSPQGGPHLKLVYRTLQVAADNKVLSNRSYSTIVVANTGHASKIRSNDRVPIPSGSAGTGNTQVVTQFRYQDVGTNIDAYGAQLSGNQLAVNLSVELNEVAKDDIATEKTIYEPIIRQLSWQSDVTVTLGRPTIIFTSDNPSDTGKTELELTATEIK